MTKGDHDVGFAFDGDGDRMLAVDRTGAVVDGDELIALAALHLREADRLPGHGVAVTVMTNYGFHTAMRAAGVEVATTPVGDRYVLEALRERGWALGGEQSGHIIDMGFVPSGDGIAAALLTLEALDGADLADRHGMEKLPQKLVNVRMADRAALAAATAAAREAIEREAAALEGRGRVLVRPSGTEPLVRVMVEAPTAEEADATCERLVARAVENCRPNGGDRSRRAASACVSRNTTLFMCGIVGYIGDRPVQEVLLEGLRKLEYRGYDSAGISILNEGAFDSVRAVGNLDALDVALSRERPPRAAPVARRRAPADHRHRPHPLGHPRPRQRGQRPPALRRRRARARRGQRHRRELHGDQAGARSPTARRSAPRPTPRSWPT